MMTLGCKHPIAEAFFFSLVTWQRYLKQSRLLKLGHSAVHRDNEKYLWYRVFLTHLKSLPYQSEKGVAEAKSNLFTD